MWVWKCESVKCEVWNTESVKSVNVQNCECVKLWKQDSFKPLELYENVKDWKFKRAKEWKCERVKVWKSESVWKCKTVNSDLNTFSFLLNLYLWLNLILNSGAVLHLHLRWRYLHCSHVRWGPNFFKMETQWGPNFEWNGDLMGTFASRYGV